MALNLPFKNYSKFGTWWWLNDDRLSDSNTMATAELSGHLQMSTTVGFIAIFSCRMFRMLHQVSGWGALRLPGGDHPLLLGCGSLLRLWPRGVDWHPNYAGEPLLEDHQRPRHPHPGVRSSWAVSATRSWKETLTVPICLPVSRIQIFQYIIYGIASFFFVYAIILLAEGFYTTSAIKKELQSDFKTTVCGRCITAFVREQNCLKPLIRVNQRQNAHGFQVRGTSSRDCTQRPTPGNDKHW